MTKKNINNKNINNKYKQIMEDIISNNQKRVCLDMVSIGMYDDFGNDILSLVVACMKNENEWIRKAGLLCLYHQYIDKRDSVCNEEFIDLVLIGKNDKSDIVLNIAEEIISEIREFSPKNYSIIKKIIDGKEMS